jgi:hypothetical protein
MTLKVDVLVARYGRLVRRPTLIVVVPTNTRWKQVDARTEIVYAVEFASTDGRALGASSGSCWEVELQVCVVRIVEDAKAAAAKLSKASDPKGG